jgi:hypothetical protein
MWFLIRMSFWLSLVILLIPADESELARSGGQPVGAFEAFGLARSAYEDARGFCGRNPDTCATGEVFAETFGAKARTGAKWVLSFIDTPAKPDPVPAYAPPAAPAHPPGLRAAQAPAAGVIPVRTVSIPVGTRQVLPPEPEASLPEPPRRPARAG